MKKWLSYIFMTAVCCMTVSSCYEKILEEPFPMQSNILKLRVYVPGETRVSGTYDSGASGLDDSTGIQRFINPDDIYVLQFNSDKKLIHVVDPLTVDKQVSNGNLACWLKGELNVENDNGNCYLVVLGNLKEQNIQIQGLGTSFSAAELLARYEGREESDIYKELIFSYPSAPWNINDRRLPLWGKTKSFSLKHDVFASCGLYRGVAKMGVKVTDDCCNHFKLKKVNVYYINEEGYFAAPKKEPSPDGGVQYTEPDIPDCDQRETPLEYMVDEYAVAGNSDVKRDTMFLNQIYVPEADNKPGGKGKKAMKIVVGGVYTGDDPDNTAVTYYLIDLMDDKDNPGGEKQPFDIIRNHSYVFNITDVTQPGAPTPEDALPHLTVSIEDYTEQFMRGVPDQYTLIVDKSVFKFPASKTDEDEDLPWNNGTQELKIETDLEQGWKINYSGDHSWYRVSKERSDRSETITITLDENEDVTRDGSFYVMTGNIKKEIKVIQKRPKVSNSYVVGDGEHSMLVTIKGNGVEGVMAANNVSLIPGNEKPTDEDKMNFVTMRPAKIGVIWETAAGLVKLINPENGSEVSNEAGRMTYVDLPADKNVIKYKVDIDGSNAEIGGVRGGNALIGAFDDNDNILWSWHIWVAPDIIDPTTQKIKDACVEKWTVNDYDLLDRNIGALSNRPNELAGANEKGVAAQGLLYQWGRKDPFIGANYSKGGLDINNLTNNGLLPVVHYYKDWGVMETQFDDATISATIADPTQLVKRGSEKVGMSSIPRFGASLWGIADGLAHRFDPGVKTIYDPSPSGYRVPPTDAFVFQFLTNMHHYEKILYWNDMRDYVDITSSATSSYYEYYNFPVYFKYKDYLGSIGFLCYAEDDGYNTEGKVLIEPPERISSSFESCRRYEIYELDAIKDVYKRDTVTSETRNWRLNLIYVPHWSSEYGTRPNAAGNDAYQWGNFLNYAEMYADLMSHGGDDDSLSFLYEGEYVKDADYYGFYLNYKNITHEPILKSVTKQGEGIYNTDGAVTSVNYYYALEEEENNETSWFPITAVYDPLKGVTLDKIMIQTGPSVTVNSFLWTNSTVKNKADNYGPGAMFLHGTEDMSLESYGATGQMGSGRHIHWLKDTTIYAEPQYAGAVRCIRNRPKTLWLENFLTDSTTIVRENNATTEITIISVSENWKLVKPGAPWLNVSPDHGGHTGGGSSTIILKILPVDDLPPVGTKTKLEFQIEGERETRTVVVEVVASEP